MTRPVEILSCLELEDSQVCHHLTPLARHPRVSRLWIVRSRRSRFAHIPKAEYRIVPRFKPLRWLHMSRLCDSLLRRPDVRAAVSFNPFPYGLIAARAARRCGKAVHFGFIGSDWYLYTRGWKGRLLRTLVRDAAFLTATGEAMRQEMIAAGLPADRIAVLPHAIDLDRFPVGDPAQALYTCVYVGKLKAAKRVDLILRAFARLAAKRPDATLCLVGRGPQEGRLRRLAARLGMAGRVTFAGFTHDVGRFLSRARINVMASRQEGFPFSLVEGMCCGAVPVTTPVGTIPDHIRDHETGLFFPANDANALAACLERLVDDGALYRRLRANVLAERSRFSYEQATAVWDRWLASLAPAPGTPLPDGTAPGAAEPGYPVRP
ncbi:MAG: glycosyltransferase [Lentisphaerae bacterium]|nr:glycosyltransferase [Lentisphaerota bacterium]